MDGPSSHHGPEAADLPIPLTLSGGDARESAHIFLYAALAEELRDIRRLIEEMAETLVTDHRFVEDYLNELQRFDLIIQRTDESADLLDRLAGGSMAHDAIERVRLASVQARLRAALLHG